MAGGTYTLLIELPRSIELEIGALGTYDIPAGWYAYTGSAFGAGGFSRIDRHRRVAAGEHNVRHWHIDYLLGHPATTLTAVERQPEEDVECAVADALPESPVAGFGSSDCDCPAHLAYDADDKSLRAAIRTAYADHKPMG